MIDFVNLTPHIVNVLNADGQNVTFAPSGTVARVSSTRRVADKVTGINVYETVMGEPDALVVERDTFYIVSRLFATAFLAKPENAKYRDYVLVPGELKRDDAGVVIGCDGLSRI